MPQKKTSKLSSKKLFNKYHALLVIVIMVLCLTSITYSLAMRNLALDSYASSADQFSKSLVANATEWSLEKSGSVEKITTTPNGWIMQAGGNTASTHYSRVKYKLPEKAALAPTTFYMKATIELPSDFYSKQKAGFRIMNTDNFLTTLNDVKVGSANAKELRTSVYLNSDHTIRIQSLHDGNPTKEYFKLATPLTTGAHTLEFYGDVANVSPWYFKVDGSIEASGVDRLSPDSVPANERIVTRMVAGIDGAAGQSSNPVILILKNFEIANFDPNSPTSLTPASTPTLTPTNTGDNTPPTIKVNYPLNNDKISDSVKIKVKASDTSGIKKINFLFDGKVIKTCNSTSTCKYTYNTKSVSSGDHSIIINAYDKSTNKNLTSTTINVVK